MKHKSKKNQIDPDEVDKQRMKRTKLTVEEIPVPGEFMHPPPPDDRLPKHEFTMGIIAPKGSGKTTLICNLLKFYKGFFHTIVIFSPTIASDEKWDYIRTLPLLADNKALREFLFKQQRQTSRNGIVENAPTNIPKIPKFDPYIPDSCFKTEYKESDLQEILEDQMAMVKYLKSKKLSKHTANRCLFVFDDLVGSSLYSGRQDNFFKKFNTNHRHYSCSALEITQAYKEIPKTIRTNFSTGILFEITNDKELEAIYEETPLGLRKEPWMAVYNHCVSDDYSFMYFNYQKPKKMRIMKNFDSYLMTDSK
jgi:hypothetical protein